MSFAQWLQEQMDKYGFTRYRIAKMAGVHQSTVANWLSGTKAQEEKENMVRQAIHDYEVNKGIIVLNQTGETDDQGIKKDLPVGEVEGLSDLQKKVWGIVLNMSEDSLRAIVQLWGDKQ